MTLITDEASGPAMTKATVGRIARIKQINRVNLYQAKFLRIHEADLAGPPPAELSPDADGQPERVHVELRFRSLTAAEALLAFGTDAEVLAPAELRQALARKAAEVAARYTADTDDR
ncbi:WCX domain-containing protein [Nonomuraea turcica]|uniref:WYL domain-containing protein n=1 Tax=Nonomuraea sp. G32 TaxID=3067274 RepID=UPI00273AC4EB|nr:WYL domain-containing protein [Nonomuraea sp. G32]MDP4510285.1 WYL domain-containing protein [Nonomuraea sp. G32]